MVEVGQLASRLWAVGEFGNGGKLVERGRWSREAIARRMWRLRQAGLLDSRRLFYDRPAVWSATGAGLREARLPLSEAVVDVRSYEHDLDCAWLLIELEREFEVVLTEREIAHADRGAPRAEFSPEAMDGRPIGRRRHLPDFAIPSYDAEGRALAIELERSVKYRHRLRDIIDLYAQSMHLAGVRYYVTSPQAERAVRRAVREATAVYLQPPVEVRRWHPPHTR